MTKPIPVKKKRAKISGKPRARAKGKKIKFPEPKESGWVIVGFDVSASSISGAAIAYDAVLKKLVGPAFVSRRWSKEDHYFDRLEMAARSHELIWDLQADLKTVIPKENVLIAQEEPFPAAGKFFKQGISNYLKQQAEISGAFLGGILRYGYTEIWQMHNIDWRTTIAHDLGITTHHTKWKSPELAQEYNCRPADSGKFRSKEWALQHQGYAWQHTFSREIPDWPDIIESNKLGKIPRPEGSIAKAVQPDDRYDALAIMWTLFLDLEKRGKL